MIVSCFSNPSGTALPSCEEMEARWAFLVTKTFRNIGKSDVKIRQSQKKHPPMHRVQEAKKNLQKQIKLLAQELLETESLWQMLALEPKLEKIKEKLCVLKYLERYPISCFEEQKQKGENQVEKTTESALSDLLDYAVGQDYLSAFEKKQPTKIQLNLNDTIGFSRELFQGNHQCLQEMIRQINQMESLESTEEYLENKIEKKVWQEKQQTIERLRVLIRKRFRK